MKTTIIDILNKIANGEKIPRVIKYNDMFYEIDKELEDYRCNGYRLFGNELEESYELIYHLKDEVEILETTITYNQDNIENNKQDKIEKIDIYDSYTNHNNLHTYINTYDKDGKIKRFVISAPQREIIIKINEIIDKMSNL